MTFEPTPREQLRLAVQRLVHNLATANDLTTAEAAELIGRELAPFLRPRPPRKTRS